MPVELRMWIEVVFNISYLVVVWSLVALMVVHRDRVAPQNRPITDRLAAAFALLALGDTGHVGFRVVAYARGGLEANPVLIGLGALSTAYTVTLFYMLMLDIWRVRFQKPLGFLGWLSLGAGIVRLAVMAFPQNQWMAVTPPYDWSMLRNGLLTLQGLIVMYLLLRDGLAEGDQTFTWMGAMVAVSFAFDLPVILFSAAVPVLGMLMIPKTLAYVAIAIIGYRAYYRGAAASARLVPAD